jgi:predicted MFS family arabinose efflux permease
MGNLLAGGMAASSNAVVGLAVERGKEGMAYGLSNGAGALAGAIGPAVGGSLASVMGFRPMFGFHAGILLLLVIYVIRFLPDRMFSAGEDSL